MGGESTVILGLGSNVGDRLANLSAAVRRLSTLLTGMHCSRVLESVALLPEAAPKEWNMPYLNMAISGKTNMPAQGLLDMAKNIEQDMGRVARGVWGPREIDIDILALGDKVIEMPALNIPHRELLNRDFALLPLIDVAPEWRYPMEGKYHNWLAAEIAADKHFVLGKHLQDTRLKIHG